ncbi:tumor necrosis factor ligand superfamily member 14-like [Haliotis rufescens]|uniref:tumor necrosis factor ligand superfamily member 14-like n=1 Tax=Haliotis rufescens TaxID=6454 RepID=UPI001EB058F1|nr:tumor necrosis factor ligand superfamily member 14-like [Haliotis rufescens]XP_046336853.1 tumor necrosis factor ligand superfamily member 14-like [Haliotis rufescens]XP_048242856.1 tumor necrosis factor ligand superfamily member 14-like [Haliotis rufescens]
MNSVICGITVLTLNVILMMVLVGLVSNTADTQTTCTFSINKTAILAAAPTWEEGRRAEDIRTSIASIYTHKSNLDKAAVHLLIDPVFNYTDAVPTLRLRHHLNVTFISDTITYIDGALTVKTGGYYFIYSQVLFSGNGTQELDYGRIIHAVVKQKASELEEAPTPLMRNLQSTPSIRRGRLAYTTSSLGATFYLEANTRVKVMSSVPGNIHVGAPHSNYFGMFLI